MDVPPHASWVMTWFVLLPRLITPAGAVRRVCSTLDISLGVFSTCSCFDNSTTTPTTVFTSEWKGVSCVLRHGEVKGEYRQELKHDLLSRTATSSPFNPPSQADYHQGNRMIGFKNILPILALLAPFVAAQASEVDLEAIEAHFKRTFSGWGQN